MNIYAEMRYSSDSNTNEFTGHFSFQPFKGVEIFSNRSAKDLEEGDYWQESVEVKGELYLIQSPSTDCEETLIVYGVSSKPMITIESDEIILIEGCNTYYNDLIESEELVQIDNPDSYFEVMTPESKKKAELSIKLTELQNQIAELQKELMSL